MTEDVDKDFAVGFQCPANLCHQDFVVLHMFEQFDRHHSIEGFGLEFMLDDIPSDYREIFEPLDFRLLLDIRLLRPRI